MFGDEASFWLDGSLHRTWARLGVQPYVETYGMRKTAHVFGALSLEAQPEFDYLFAPVFNGETFLLFLQQLGGRALHAWIFPVDRTGRRRECSAGRGENEGALRRRAKIAGARLTPCFYRFWRKSAI